jgi:hypothetical protein
MPRYSLRPLGSDARGALREGEHHRPREQRVRVAGRLDTIRCSDRLFTLKLESGVTLRGIAEGVPPETLAGLFGKRVTVSAMATFRPSGRVLKLQADRIEPGGDDFSLWSVEPRPLWGAAEPSVRQPQGPHSGINAIIGRWPGNESEAEISAALEVLS